MTNLEKRIAALEERLGMRPGPRCILITNVGFLDGHETPNEVEFLPGLYALAYGGPLTDGQIQKL